MINRSPHEHHTFKVGDTCYPLCSTLECPEFAFRPCKVVDVFNSPELGPAGTHRWLKVVPHER